MTSLIKEHDERKQKILLALKRKEMATGEVQAFTGLNYWIIKQALEDLEKAGLIESRKQKNAKFWRLKK